MECVFGAILSQVSRAREVCFACHSSRAREERGYCGRTCPYTAGATCPLVAVGREPGCIPSNHSTYFIEVSAGVTGYATHTAMKILRFLVVYFGITFLFAPRQRPLQTRS